MPTGKENTKCHTAGHCPCCADGKLLVRLRNKLMGKMKSVGPVGSEHRNMILGGWVVWRTRQVAIYYFFGDGGDGDASYS